MGTINQEVALTRDVIRQEQLQDRLCNQYRHQDEFWTDEENLLYRRGPTGQSCTVIPTSLVPVVLKNYHELPFTAHQGVGRTVEFIKRKYWWETLASDVREYIRQCDACARRKTGSRINAPLGDQLEAKEFLDIVSLDVVGPLPLLRKGISIYLHLWIISRDFVKQYLLLGRILRLLLENL